MNTKLMGLVAKWRGSASRLEENGLMPGDSLIAMGKRNCADDLAALIREGEELPDLYRDDWMSPADLEKRLETLAEEYEWRGDSDYTPTEAERAMLIDFAHGIMADDVFVVMMKAHHDPQAKGRPAAKRSATPA